MSSEWNLMTNFSFDFLYQQVIYSSILFICLLPIYHFLKRFSPYWCVYLWGLVLARLVIPPNFALPFSARSVLGKVKDIVNNYSLQPLSNNLIEDHTSTLDLLSNNDLVSLSPQMHWLKILMLLAWLVGLIVMSVRFYRMHKCRKRILKNCNTVTNVRLQEQLKTWQNIFGIERDIELVSSVQNLPPFTTGIWKPVIYIPECLLNEPGLDACNACIGHEMAHIKHFDYFWLQIQWLLKIIYFFHPVVWYSCRQINRHKEQICDYESINSGGINKEPYLKGLVKVINDRTIIKQKTAMQPSLGLQYKMIIERINLIKELNTMSKKYCRPTFLVAILFAIFLLPMASFSEPTVATSNEITSVLESISSPLREGRISSRFGLTTMPLGPQKGQERFHRGIDIAAKSGTPIYAVSDGIVEIAIDDYENSKKPAYGNHIKISHGDKVQSIYLKLDKVLVKSGQTVTIGQKIGTMGSTGLSTAPHLHFELHIDGTVVDPQQYIQFKL